MARKPVAVRQMKNYAVIRVWRKGGGTKSAKVFDDTFEKVTWFNRLVNAKGYYSDEPQGQTEQDGECNRYLVKVIKRLA